jgi:carbon-monoxide dehydrogenase large subunit
MPERYSCRCGWRALFDDFHRNHPKSPGMDDRTTENALSLTKFGIGQPVRRSEDPTLVRGEGRYTDDTRRTGQTYSVMVRSSVAHGLIRGIDTAAAKAMPGVLAVYTAADLTGYGGLKCNLPLKSREGSPIRYTPRPALAGDKVRFVGDPFACVIAETIAQAKDGAEAVVLDIEPLPAVVSARASGSMRATGVPRCTCTPLRR